MDDTQLKEVDFRQYCKQCKFYKSPEAKDPCNGCLEVPMREGTIVPVYFKDKKENE